MAKDLESLSAQWDHTLAENDHRQALDVAIEGFRLASAQGNQVQRMMFLGFVRVASARLFDDLAERRPVMHANDQCSFCGRSDSDLSRGIAGAICRRCAEAASAVYAEKG